MNQDTKWDILNYKDGAFRIDRWINSSWKSNPFKIDNNDNLYLGTPTSKLGFFGKNGNSQQTAITDATDLESVIALTNNLKSILKKYNLIK